MPPENPSITVEANGPYQVHGLPLVRKAPVVSEHGEPLTWKTGPALAVPERYLLCRCGQSANKPFCDGSHARVGFDGGETAPTAGRRRRLAGTGVELRDEVSLCIHAGFCGNRFTNVWKMVAQTEDSIVRGRLLAMVEHCPSGRLSAALGPEDPGIEPDLPRQIGLIQDGPLWVTGGVPIQGADGQPLPARGRVTLCRCGASRNKPLCDGSHAAVGFRDGPAAVQAAVQAAAPAARNEAPATAGPAPAPAGPGPATAGPEHGPVPEPADEAGRYFRYMAEFIGFTAAEAAAIRRTGPLVEAELAGIVTDFYDKLLRYPPTRRFFLRPDGSLDQEYLELRMRHQVNFWRRTAQGLFDDDYARYVDFVGRAHTARGADPSIYVAERYVIGMVGFVQHAISKLLQRALDGESERALAEEAVEAWDKLLMVILELLARAYGEERAPETFEPLVAVDRGTVARLAASAFAEEVAPPSPGPLRELPVAMAAEIPVGERRIVQVGETSIGVFHLEDGWHAVANYCLHRGGPVATGPLAGTVLTCPWHGYRYDLVTGRCLADPSAELDRFEVLVRDGQVLLRVPETT